MSLTGIVAFLFFDLFFFEFLGLFAVVDLTLLFLLLVSYPELSHGKMIKVL